MTTPMPTLSPTSRLCVIPVLICVFGSLRASAAPPTAAAPTPTPEQVKFFESKVRPLLVENCYSCHGDKKQKGGLRLDSIQVALKGGKNGPAIVPGKPAESKLVVAVSYKDEDLQMPPDDALPAEQVAVLAQWVQMGAPWPASGGAAVTVAPSKKRTITDEDRAFWSFQPPREVAPPAVADNGWSKSSVDPFVFAKLAAEGLTPAPEADKVTLVRRAYLDLHGLPPTPAEVGAFVNDSSESAWPNLIDRLLASPRYGERMARHWLDLVRYAESDGYRQDAFRPHAWPYRDYVIKSFNDDKPYDRFVREQLAGDELAPEDPTIVIGTAFLRHGQYEYNQRDVHKHWQNIVDEVTDVAADAFLGLSMGCAKCHDHKFDPILQSDYYRFQAFFSAFLPRNDVPLATPAERAKYAAAMKVWEEKTKGLRAEIAAIEAPFVAKTAEKTIAMFPEDIQAIVHKKERTPYEEQIAQLALRQVYDKTEAGEAKVTGPQKEKHLELVRKLAEFDDLKPKPLQLAFVATDVGPVAPPQLVVGTGDKTPVEPGYPVVLDGQPLAIPEVKATARSTGRRTALANWLTQPDHPLTTRVIVNRLWQYHFGRGLVATSSDYGRIGDRPSHPELLDYLARQLTSNGWSLKHVHRLIMTSAAYRQSSSRPAPETAKLKDPENRWLWKYPPRRLDAEQIRDAMLMVSGELKPDMFGPGVDPTTARRSVYTKAIRNVRDPLLDAFDLPDSFGSAADRNRTTTATQALLLINGDAPLKRAEVFAARLRGMNLKTPEETVTAAWQLAYNRAPSEKERHAATAFLKQSTPSQALATNQQLAASNSPTSIDEKPIVKQMPQLGSQAIYVRNARPDDMLRLPAPAGMPSEDLTVEAYVYLDSLYENASVRIIASQWDGKNDHPGWSFGVTSLKSKHEPQNLILQLACDPDKPGGGYEVIPSDFRVELHKTYYVAVSMKLSDTSNAGVTFYLKDVGDMDAPLKSVSVRHRLTGSYANDRAVMIGGRDSQPPMGWDGLIDEVRITRKALTREQLLFNEGTPAANLLAAHWTFEDRPGIFKDSAAVQKDLVKPKAGVTASKGPTTAPAAGPRPDSALVDFCHVLLNSNRFLYLE
jgi:hypothetical protein